MNHRNSEIHAARHGNNLRHIFFYIFLLVCCDQNNFMMILSHQIKKTPRSGALEMWNFFPFQLYFALKIVRRAFNCCIITTIFTTPNPKII